MEKHLDGKCIGFMRCTIKFPQREISFTYEFWVNQYLQVQAPPEHVSPAPHAATLAEHLHVLVPESQ